MAELAKAKRLMYIEGVDGHLELLTDRVVIHRTGFLNMMYYGGNSRREIPLGALSEVMFIDARKFRYGEIEFLRSGNRSGPSEPKKTRRNPYLVKFQIKNAQQFLVFKEKIFEMIELHNKTKN